MSKILNRFRFVKFGMGEKPGQIVFDKRHPSKTDPSFKDACDINNILAGYKRANLPLPGPSGDALYGDFSSLPSFIDAQNQVIRANEQFAQLPAKVRKQLDNDPAKFLAFVSDPKNNDEMYALGLKVKPVVADPQASGEVLPSPSSSKKAPSSAGQADKA